MDAILDGMASEIRDALLRRGLDPEDPPQHRRPPAAKAWQEYQRRGGKQDISPDQFVNALVRRVGELD